MTQPRGQDRDSLFLLANLRVADQAEQRIKVRNLSPGGMMAEGAMRAVCGMRVSVDLRNIGWVGGTVAWATDSRFGVVFDHEIDCKVVRVTSAQLPEVFVPRPLNRPSGPVRGADPGVLRRI